MKKGGDVNYKLRKAITGSIIGFFGGDMMIERWVKNKYYVQLSLSIIAYSMVIVIILSAIFANIYSKSLLEQMIGEYKTSINKMNIGFENLNKEIDQLYLLLQMDINVYTYLNQYVNDDMTRIQAGISANKVYQISPYVDSMVLYNTKTNDYILLGNSSFDPAQTVKKERSAVNSRARIKRLVPNEVRTNEGGYPGKKHIISLVYSELSSDKKTIESIVIINLDWNAVQDGILEKPNGITLICDNNGNGLAYPDNALSKTKKSLDRYFKYITADNKSLDSITLETDHQHEVVTYIKNEENGWCIINIRSYGEIIENLQKKRNVVIMIASVVLIICLLIGYFISKMLYSPIQKITNMFKLSKYAAGMNTREELSLISQVYQGVLKHVDNLEQKNENYLPQIKEDFLRGLLRNGEVEKDFEEKLRDYQVGIEFSNLFVVLLKIDYDEEQDEKKKSIYETTTIVSALKLLENNFKWEVVNMFDGEICLLLNCKQERNNYLEKLVADLKNVIAMIHKIPGGHVTIGLGGVVNQPADCQKAYAEARDMIKYKFVLGYDQVIYQGYIDAHLTNSINYPKEIEKKLVSAIHTNSREDFLKHLESFIGILKNYLYQDAIIIFLQVVLECIRDMNQVIAGHRSIKIDFDDFGLIFGKLQTLEQAKEWMIHIFDEHQALLREIAVVKDHKYYAMVEDIKAYINANFADINLGVEMLAEKTGYTPNYFAKIFKSITGQYLNDYIMQVRITKAKELLKNSKYSINKISSMAGFINSTYFYSAFKKEVGLTPTLYRNYKNIEEAC